MHSFLSRGNGLCAFSLTTLAVATFLLFVSTMFKDYNRDVKISVGKVSVKSVPNYQAQREVNDLGYVTLNLDADLTSLFDWNVKQLFVYLTAEYQSPTNAYNQIVLWDKIILRGENSVLSYKNANVKYYFWDDGNGLKNNQNVTLSLTWNVIPNAGFLKHIKSGSKHVFAFPAEYTKLKQ